LGSSDSSVRLRKLAVKFVDTRHAVLLGSCLQIENLSLQGRDFRLDCVDATPSLHKRHVFAGIVVARGT